MNQSSSGKFSIFACGTGQDETELNFSLSYILVVVVLRLGLPVPVASREMEPGGVGYLWPSNAGDGMRTIAGCDVF